MARSRKKQWTLPGATLCMAATVVLVGMGVLAGAGAAASVAIPKNKTLPTIAGVAQQGAVLKANEGIWKSNWAINYAYQWRRCLADGTGCVDIAGATDSIYAVRMDDVAHALRVTVLATNKQGSAVAISAPTAAITALPASAPHVSAPPTVSGTQLVGQVLVASSGTWTGTTPLVYSYRWRRCSPTGGACRETAERTRMYRVTNGDAGRTVRVLVTVTNGSGTSSALSAPSGKIAKAQTAPPQNTSLPMITGTAQQGQRLTGSRGSWTDSPSAFRYAWLRCDRSGNNCGLIGGARSTAYSPGSADLGHTIRFEVDASNNGGTTRAFSVPTPSVAAAPVVAKAPPANSSPPTIAGTAQDGQTLTGSPGNWTNSPTKYEYTWRRCNENGNNCDEIGGAHASTYKLTSKDVGKTIRLRVKATNGDGSNQADSKPTAVVRASGKPENSSPPTISGTPTEGKTLTGSRGNWTHSPTSYGYSWQRCDRNGNNCAGIGGAHATTYTVTSADVGNTIRFAVTASNSAGSQGAASVPTAVIQKAVTPPPPPPSRGSGCPAGNGNPDQVSTIASPARLLVDSLQASPRVVTRNTSVLVVRFHVTSTCGGPVQGALVYATATPFGQFAIPPEAPTGSDGWATLTFRRLSGFPVSNRQQLIAMFVRARKPGENLLLGISTRRLVSVPVNLHS